MLKEFVDELAHDYQELAMKLYFQLVLLISVIDT